MQKISRFLIYAVVALIPLFTLPFTADVLNFPKQCLFLLLISLAVFFWIGGMIAAKKITLKYNKSIFIIIILLAAALVSSLVSLYPYGSFWGLPLSTVDNFANLFGFALLYLLIINLFDQKSSVNLLFCAIISCGLAGLYALLQGFGLYLVPFGYAKSSFFNTVGTASGLIFVVAVCLCAALPLIFISKGWRKWLLIICAVVFGLDMIFYNVTLGWITVSIGLLGLFLFAMSSDKFAAIHKNVRSISFLLLTIAIIFVCLNFFGGTMMPNVYSTVYECIHFNPQPLEVYLTQPATAKIVNNTLRQTATTFFFGSGPGTFIYDFEKFKPAQIVQNDNFWNVEFTNGASEILDIIATKGFLGILIFAVFLGYIIWRSFRLLTDDQNNNEMLPALFSGLLAIIAALFVYPLTFVSGLLLWLLVALIGTADKKSELSFAIQSIKSAYVSSLLIIILLIAQAGCLIWLSKRYYAEVKYANAGVALQKNNINDALQNLLLATSSVYNKQDNYLTDLAQIYLMNANQISQQMNQQNKPQEEIVNAIVPYLKGSIDAVQAAVNANKNNVVNWSVRGYVMSQMAGLGVAGDPADLAEQSYKKALELEPNNPTLWTQLGQIMLQKKDLASAKNDFQKAIELNPKYSNARYYLGLIYDENGDKQAAINEFTIIAQLNPDNQTVSQILQNLQSGKPALGEPPVTSATNTEPSLQPEQNLPGILPNINEQNQNQEQEQIQQSTPTQENSLPDQPAISNEKLPNIKDSNNITDGGSK